MDVNQFIHVSQFYETIMCASIVILIVQRIILIIKDKSAQYAQYQFKYQDFQSEKSSLKNQTEQIQPQNRVHKQEELYNRDFSNSIREPFRSSIHETVQKPLDEREEKKQYNNQGVIRIEDTISRTKSMGGNDNKKPLIQDVQNQPSEEINVQNTIQHKNQTQNQKLQYNFRNIKRIDIIFDQFWPLLICTMIIGSLCQSTYIYSMCCFFFCIFSSLIFNYVHLLSRHAANISVSLLIQVGKLISGFFILTLYLSFWIDDQFYTG